MANQSEYYSFEKNPEQFSTDYQGNLIEFTYTQETIDGGMVLEFNPELHTEISSNVSDKV